MRVKRRMTPNPVTVPPEATHREAVDLMRRNNIRRLPVVNKAGKLVGIVTQSDILSNTPSPATTLSVYEIYTLLDQLTVQQFMSSPVYAVDEECGLATAARFMVEKKFSALPVVRGQELVGIITETDIFKAFLEALGGGLPGARFDIRVPDTKGMLAQVAQAVADVNANIVSVTEFRGDDPEHAVLSIKERGADLDALQQKLRQIDSVEILEFHTGEHDCLLTIGG